MFGVCRLIDVVVPDVPRSLDLKIKRERYLAKQALADTGAAALVLLSLRTQLTSPVQTPKRLSQSQTRPACLSDINRTHVFIDRLQQNRY